MILAFSTQLNNKPTLFVEKILNSMHYDLKLGAVINDYLIAEKHQYDAAYKLVDAIRSQKAKKHTIRKDTSNRWKAGNDIHFSINVRTKNQFQFAPVVKCVSVQKIEIEYENIGVIVLVDDKPLTTKQVLELAINDGFNSIEEFFEYFNKDFTGKIIHWTNLKY